MAERFPLPRIFEYSFCLGKHCYHDGPVLFLMARERCSGTQFEAAVKADGYGGDETHCRRQAENCLREEMILFASTFPGRSLWIRRLEKPGG